MDYIEIKAKPKRKTNLLTMIPLIIVVSFFAFQLFVLTNVGDKGEKITELRRKQAELKISNEIYKSKLMELQTNTAVIEPLYEMVKVEKKSVNVIDIEESGLVSAMR